MTRTLTGLTVATALAAASFALGAATVGNAGARRNEATKLHILVSRAVAITGLRGVESAVARCPSGYIAFSGAYQTTAGSEVEIITATPTRDNGFGVTAYAGPLTHKATIVVKAFCLERDQAYITASG